MKKIIVLASTLALILSGAPPLLWATIINIPYTATTGNPVQGTGFNSNMTTIYNDYNGNVTDANISGSAAISGTKLANSSVTLNKISSSLADATLGNLLTQYKVGCALNMPNLATVTITSPCDIMINGKLRRVTVDLSVNLTNNLDAGVAAVSTWYHLYATADGATTTFLASFSLSTTAPTGFTNYRYLGSVLSDPVVASNLIQRSLTQVDPLMVFNSVGASETTTSVAYTDLSTSQTSKVVLPRGMWVAVTIAFTSSSTGAAGTTNFGQLQIGGAAQTPTDFAIYPVVAASTLGTVSRTERYFLAAGLQTFALQFKVSSGLGTFVNRSLIVSQ